MGDKEKNTKSENSEAESKNLDAQSASASDNNLPNESRTGTGKDGESAIDRVEKFVRRMPIDASHSVMSELFKPKNPWDVNKDSESDSD